MNMLELHSTKPYTQYYTIVHFYTDPKRQKAIMRYTKWYDQSNHSSILKYVASHI